MGQVIPLSGLAEYGARQRAGGQRIVFTNGHFDLLHIGHIRYLQAARAYGDVLVVGVNDDPSTTARKGAGRPIIPASERAETLAALACVDRAVIFAGMTADEPIRLLQPDVYVKGGDYALSPEEERAGKTPLPEAPTVRGYGGAVVTVALVPGRSTTDIVRSILRVHGCQEADSTHG
jgi:D-glycero-beta-D-manno-heptose 1-phosphate adenylyltransferase